MPQNASGLVVDRLAWERRASPLSFAVEPHQRIYVCGEAAPALLLALAGFLPHFSGRVVCDGRDLTGIAPPARHVAYIPGGDSLIGRSTLLANVALPGGGRAAAAAILARLGLDEAMHHPAAALPAPQRRLAALARALVAEPALLLVQEAADDPAAIPDGLRALARPTALVATNSAAVALARAEKILLLQGGRLVQFAPPTDVYQRPADAFAASWSGACNLIPAMLDGAGPVAGSVQARVCGHAMAARQRDHATGPALLAIRPHHLTFGPDGVPGVVQSIDYQGAITRITVATAGSTLLLDTPMAGEVAQGAPVHVTWRWADAWPVPA